jgi:hypothetical protein
MMLFAPARDAKTSVIILFKTNSNEKLETNYDMKKSEE